MFLQVLLRYPGVFVILIYHFYTTVVFNCQRPCIRDIILRIAGV